MRRIILVLLFSLFYSIKAQPPVYRYVNVYGQEGMSNTDYFDISGKQKYLSIITEFEKEFKRTKNNYSDYYRLYILIGGISPDGLSVYLIPKSIVLRENKKKKEFRVFGDERTLGVHYDLETKKISKPYKAYILYDI